MGTFDTFLRCLFFGVAIVATVAFRLWRARRGSWLSELGSPEDPVPSWRATGRPTLPNDHAPSGFAIIREGDPHFDTEAFYDHVREMFIEIHTAAARRDLRVVAGFIEPDLLTKVEAHMRGETGAPRILHDGELQPLRIGAMSIDRREGYDIVHVLIQAKGPTDVADDIVENPDAEGLEQVVRFREYWTLVRSVGAVSRIDWSIHKCPNCGGPINTDDRATCSYCGVRMADPAYDWVVRKIAAD